MHVRTHRLPSTRVAAHLGVAAVATLVGLALVTSCTDDSRWIGRPTAAAGAGPTGVHRASWLFSMNAASADVVPVGDTYEVTLVRPGQVVAFTDRPARKARRLVTSWLVGAWEPLFAADPPNAALTGLAADGSAVDATVEVRHLTGDDAALIVTVRGIGDDAEVRLPTHLTDVSLFVDDAVLVPTDAVRWAYHSIIPPNGSGSKYLAEFQIKRDRIDAGDTDLIYSLPAEALIDAYSDAHLRPADAGVQLYGSTAGIDGP